MPTDISEFQVKTSDPETPPKLWVKFLGCVVVSIPFMMLWLATLKGFNLTEPLEFKFCIIAGVTVCLGESMQESFGETLGEFAQKMIEKFRKQDCIDEMHSKFPADRTHEDSAHSKKPRQVWLSLAGRLFINLIVFLTGFSLVTALKLPFPSEHKLLYPILFCYPLAMATIGTFGGRVGTRLFSKGKQL